MNCTVIFSLFRLATISGHSSFGISFSGMWCLFPYSLMVHPGVSFIFFAAARNSSCQLLPRSMSFSCTIYRTFLPLISSRQIGNRTCIPSFTDNITENDIAASAFVRISGVPAAVCSSSNIHYKLCDCRISLIYAQYISAFAIFSCMSVLDITQSHYFENVSCPFVALLTPLINELMILSNRAFSLVNRLRLLMPVL